MIYGDSIQAVNVTRKSEMLKKELKLRENSYAHMVLQFMSAFDQIPRLLSEQVPKKDFELASALIREELAEFKIGFNRFEQSQSYENMVEMVDGACDLIYVIIWAMLKFAIPFDQCFEAVQFSNMSKLSADGKYEKYPEGHELAGKVKKPQHYVKVDELLHEILIKHFDTAIYRGNMRVDSSTKANEGEAF